MIHTPPLGAPSNYCYPRTIRSRKNSLRGSVLILHGSISHCKVYNSQRSPIHLQAQGSSTNFQTLAAGLLVLDTASGLRSPFSSLEPSNSNTDNATKARSLAGFNRRLAMIFSGVEYSAVPNEAPISLEFKPRKKYSRGSGSSSIERLLSFSLLHAKSGGK